VTDGQVDHDVTGQSVLVTGGAGFIGSHIADALVPENDVTILDNLASGHRKNVPEDAELIVGDVRNDDHRTAAMEGVDIVFHEAAIVSVARSVEAPLETNRTNADATLCLLEDARREDARAILASSAAIYGHPDAVPVAESHPKRPTSPYGMSKLVADHYARVYADLYGLPTVALRYFNAYGPRQPDGDYSGVIGTFVEQARSDVPLTVNGDGEQTRDFVHVTDIVRANVQAATTDATGEAYNVGTGTAVTIGELAERIRTAAGSNSSITTVEERTGDIRHSRADTTAARERLGFAATVPLERGLSTLPSLS
jgi:UDP-glucose 4-epimerase